MTSRFVGLSLLAAVTACASTQSARPTLTPRNGPKATIHVSYDGYLTSREVRPRFQVDKSAYVIVGRLGGDGRIEILFPETPRSSNLVEGKKWYTMDAFQSQYDGVPRLFNYTQHAYRSPSARWSSYDGRGNGFVFIIATEQPMFTELLDDHGFWSDSLVVDDYYSLNDPRYAIRDFADELTRGLPYSLDYANSFTTTANASYADVAYDCNLLTNYGWGMTGFGGFGFVSGSFFDPASSFYFRSSTFGFTSRYGYGFGYTPCGGGYSRPIVFYYGLGFGTGQPLNNPVSPTPPATPTVNPETPRNSRFNTGARRPGHLAGEDESRTDVNVTRARFAPERPQPTTSSWAPPINAPRSFADPVYRTNGSNQGTLGATRTEGVTRTAQPATPAPKPAAAAPTHSTPPKPTVQNPGSTQRDP